jgi:hypothetical protein
VAASRKQRRQIAFALKQELQPTIARLLRNIDADPVPTRDALDDYAYGAQLLERIAAELRRLVA